MNTNEPAFQTEYREQFIAAETARIDGPTTRRNDEYVAFWMDSPLCNFYMGEPFTYAGHHFENSEAAFMYGKALCFDDQKAVERILLLRMNPGTCKMIGRSIVPYVEQTWTERRRQVMYDVCLSKFGSHQYLEDYLLDTGDRVIIEASTQDLIWGNGLYPSDPRNADKRKWKGLNLLGEVLMDVREELRNDHGFTS